LSDSIKIITRNSSVSRQLVYGHFIYDNWSTDISTTDISSTTSDETNTISIEAGLMQGINAIFPN